MYLFSLIRIFGGLALFLFGVEQSSGFFRRDLGSEARDLMARYTRRKYQAFLMGVGLSALTQSSTIATSFAVGFVDVGMMTFAASLVVMMGASLGGTFVSFLLSLNLFDYAPLMFGVSFFLKKAKNRWISKAAGLLQCLSLIFLGMLILGMGTHRLFSEEGFRSMMASWTSNRAMMGVIAFLAAGVLQSSSAIMALGISLADTGVLPAASALPIALGAHIGSTTMVVLAGMTGSRSARRLGWATFFFKLIGGLAFIAVYPFAHRIFVLLGVPASDELVRGQVLIAAFNILLFLPFPDALPRISARFAGGGESIGEPRYINDELLAVPEVAVRLLSKEMQRFANYMEAYLQMLLEPSQRDEKFFPRLPEALSSLSDACQEFAYKVAVPSGSEKLAADFTVVSSTMTILRNMQKLLCGGLREGLDTMALYGPMERLLGAGTWNEWRKMSRRCARQSLRAFVIGERGLVRSVETLERDFGDFCARLRRRLDENGGYSRDTARSVRVISLMQAFVSMAKEVALAEELQKRRSGRASGLDDDTWKEAEDHVR